MVLQVVYILNNLFHHHFKSVCSGGLSPSVVFVNSPFQSHFQSLFQRESKSETFFMAMSSTFNVNKNCCS